MHSIWAVAVNTIKQALRVKVAVVFIILLIILLPAIASTSTGDNTIKGRLQTFVSYGFSFTTVLLCLFTIIISTYTLNSDLKQMQIYTVLTKPVRRYQFIIGKLLGVILLDAALLAMFSLAIYLIATNMPKFASVSDEQQQQLNDEFFTARRGAFPPRVDVVAEAEAVFDDLKSKGQIPARYTRSKQAHEAYIRNISDRLKVNKRAVEPAGELRWIFENIKLADPQQPVFVKFKYDVSVNPVDLNIFSRWSIGDHRQLQYSYNLKTPIYMLDRKDVIRTFHEMPIPADAVAEDGYLEVRFLNDSRYNSTVVIFPPADGIEVLYKADSFEANFMRATMLVFFQLVFLACLGIFASTFLSFPVAILLCITIFSMGMISVFILESFEYLGENLNIFYTYTAGQMIKLLPQFDKINPTQFLVSGKLISWSLISKSAAVLLGIKSFLLLITSLVIFRYKEIAKVII